MITELGRRSGGRRESGAFLLGEAGGVRRQVLRVEYYDDLDPHCLDSGIVDFDGSGFARLWQVCRQTGLDVVADVHTHGRGQARQSPTDQANPMMSRTGHIALIVPDLAKREIAPHEVAIYQYVANHQWQQYLGPAAARFLYTGFWA